METANSTLVRVFQRQERGSEFYFLTWLANTIHDCVAALHGFFFCAGKRQTFRVKKNMRMLKKKRLLVCFFFLASVAIARVLAGLFLQSGACLLGFPAIACVLAGVPLRWFWLAALFRVFFAVLTWISE